MAPGQFSIAYHHPAEPPSGGAVQIATIELADRIQVIQLYHTTSGWFTSGLGSNDGLAYLSFAQALTASHRAAYHYAASLTASQPSRNQR